MRFLIINTDYPFFLKWLYSQHPCLQKKPYEEQMRVRGESLFGVADFYSTNLQKLGHEARDIYVNNQFMQQMWARERGRKVEFDWEWRLRLRWGIVPWISRIRMFYKMLATQIRHYKPDVLLNLAMDSISTSFLREVRPQLRLMIGLGEPPVLLNKQDWQVYDLVLAPSEGMVDYFREIGLKAELLRFGFEPNILLRLNHNEQRTVPISFVGSIGGKIHARRIELLEALCTNLSAKSFIWSPSVKHLPKGSIIHKCYHGAAWGYDLYRILASSKITFNCHSDIDQRFADNMRLYEATGSGALLITDWKKNLHDIFALDREIVTYRTSDECSELIRYYLEHDDERASIACAGQKRTLQNHTYYHRMKEMMDIVRKYL